MNLFHHAVVESQVAEVPSIGNQSFRDGRFDSALRFVRMRTVRKVAFRDERTKLAEVPFHFFGASVVKLELSNAGRIDDPAAEREANEFGRRRRVHSLVIDLTHFAHAQTQSGFEDVEERRFPDAGLPGDDARLSIQQFPEPLDADTSFRAGEYGRDAELRIGSDERLADGRFGEVYFVEHENGSEVSPFRRGEVPIDEVNFQFGFEQRNHDDHLIHVRDEDVFAIAAGSR